MSFDIVLQPLESDADSASNAEAVLRVVAPLVEEQRGNWARVTTADGSADVYGVDDAGDGLMLNHASGQAVWDLIFDLAEAGRFVVLPAGCGTCVLLESDRHRLPAEFPGPVIVVRSGDDIRRHVEAS